MIQPAVTFGSEGMPGPNPLYREFRHPNGSWNSACPHRRRAGMTVVPSPACPACVEAGDAAKILGTSTCGQFEFLLYKGQQVVVCTECWTYGKPGQNHEHHTVTRHPTDPWTITKHPDDEYCDLMNEVVGIRACHVCKGQCHVEEVDRQPCRECGGTGRDSIQHRAPAGVKSALYVVGGPPESF